MTESGRENIITLGKIEGKGAVGRALHQHCRLSEKSFVLFNLFYPEVHKVDLWQVYGIAKVAVGSNPI